MSREKKLHLIKQRRRRRRRKTKHITTTPSPLSTAPHPHHHKKKKKREREKKKRKRKRQRVPGKQKKKKETKSQLCPQEIEKLKKKNIKIKKRQWGHFCQSSNSVFGKARGERERREMRRNVVLSFVWLPWKK